MKYTTRIRYFGRQHKLLLILFPAILLLTAFIIWQKDTIFSDRANHEITAVLGIALEPPHLDPTAGSAAAIGEITYGNIFEGLTRINEQGEVLPALAENWQILEDGLVYMFRIQESVTFHDGRLLTLQDIKNNLEKIIASDSINPQRSLFREIETIEISGNRELIIRLTKPSSRFLFNLGLPAAVIVSLDPDTDNKTKPVGTGPFIFSRWQRGDRLELKKSNAYWGKPANLERVIFRFISDPTAALAGLLSGDIDAFPNYPAAEALLRIGQAPHLAYSVGATQGKTILAINNKRPFLKDIRVRRALAHAIDRSVIIRDGMNGTALPIGSHFSPVEKGYVDLTGQYPYNPEEAKKLLKEAGAENITIKLALPPPAYARRSGEVIAYQLGKAGIDVTIEQVEWAEWLSKVFHGQDYDLSVVAHVEPFDLDIYARKHYYFGYHNTHYQAIYEKLSTEQNEQERLRLIEEAQKIIADDCVNVFLFLLPKITVWNKKLEGIWQNAPVPANVMSDVRWVQ